MKGRGCVATKLSFQSQVEAGLDPSVVTPKRGCSEILQMSSVISEALQGDKVVSGSHWTGREKLFKRKKSR